MAKQIQGYIKLQVPAGSANPSPPVGPALGQHGVNIMDFCNAFNGETKEMEKGIPIPVTITVFSDRSFEFTRKLPPVSHYLKKFAKIKKGSGEPGKVVGGKISMKDIKEIAAIKIEDMNAHDVDMAANSIKGSAQAMGLEVLEDAA